MGEVCAQLDFRQSESECFRQHIKGSFELVVLATLVLPLVPRVPLTLAPLVRLAVFILPLHSVSGLLVVSLVPICVAGCDA